MLAVGLHPDTALTYAPVCPQLRFRNSGFLLHCQVGLTAGLAESDGSLYRRVYDSRHLQADCQEPGSAPEPYGR